MAVARDHLQFEANPPRGVYHPAFDQDTPFKRYIDAITGLVDDNVDELPCRVAQELCELVKQKDWLPEACRGGCSESYCRHVLYADPEGRFTVMAIVWNPGQATPVHGHTAWGAVGVYEGHPSVDVYECNDGKTTRKAAEISCCPGEVSHVLKGTDAPHCVYNASDDVAITIHTYGRDLTIDPCCINIPLE